MSPRELAVAMAEHKKFKDKITGKVFIFISVDFEGNVVGLTEYGNTAISHAKNLEVIELEVVESVESTESNQSNTTEKTDDELVL